MFQGNDDYVANIFLAAEGRFEIFGIDVEAGGSNDYILLAALEAQIPFRVQFAQISGAEPAIIFFPCLLDGAFFPIAAGDVFATNQNFPVTGEPELAAGKNFAYRAFGSFEWMIEADE